MFKVGEAQVTALERLMDHCQKDLEPLKSFTLPGGGRINAFLHQARTVCRRAEREVLKLTRVEPVNEWALRYVNRLSDAFFVLGRWVGKHMSEKEYLWERGLSAHSRPRKKRSWRVRGGSADMRSAVIAGVYEFPERTTTRSALEIQALSARAALADAGLAPKDVNGYFTVGTNPGVGPLATVDYLNLHPTYIDGTTIGGSSFVAHVNHAAAAIAEGRCRVALITYGSTARSSGIAVGTRERIAGEYVDQFEGLYGISTVGLYALVAQRHMHGFGTTSAGHRDYLVSAAAETGPRAFAEAGVTHDDIDTAMIYDSFTITVLMTLEDLGFCKKGEGGRFVEGGRLQLGGALPINTDGGGLSSNHPGMRGIFLVIEAVKQLRGECGDRQVKDCRVALLHGTGGTLGTRHSGATLILGRA